MYYGAGGATLREGLCISLKTGAGVPALLDGSLAQPRAGLPPDLPEPDLVVWNKADLGFERDGLCISLKTGEGLAMLQDVLQQKVRQRLEGDAPVLTRPRYRQALKEAAEALTHGLAAPAQRPELLAEDLRLAMRAIGRITGRVDVEEVLDFVFRDFCIGK
jgi:tRNA modification GTPase